MSDKTHNFDKNKAQSILCWPITVFVPAETIWPIILIGTWNSCVNINRPEEAQPVLSLHFLRVAQLDQIGPRLGPPTDGPKEK
jgi:hypothetical protein